MHRKFLLLVISTIAPSSSPRLAARHLKSYLVEKERDYRISCICGIKTESNKQTNTLIDTNIRWLPKGKEGWAGRGEVHGDGRRLDSGH